MSSNQFSSSKQQEQLDSLINFQDSYNEQQFLKNKNDENNKNTQKLSIMGDFNQICKKLIKQNDGQVENNDNKNSNSFLVQYYAKLKQNDTKDNNSSIKQVDINININKNDVKIIKNTIIKSPIINNNGEQLRNSLQNIHKAHKQQPGAFDIIRKQPISTTQFKRDYYSVQQKKKNFPDYQNQSKPSTNIHQKILQKSNTSIINSNNNNNHTIVKDYYGDENNFVNRKIHGKNFINSKDKNKKSSLNQNQDGKIIEGKNQRIIESKNKISSVKNQKNQNCMKQSNVIVKGSVVNQNINEKQGGFNINNNINKPKIVLYKKIIDLTQSTQSIIQAFKNQQMKSDYQLLSNQSQSKIQQGLFAKAIVHQRATKTVQNVQSSSSVSNHHVQYSKKQLQQQRQQQQQQNYVSSPITHHSNHSNQVYINQNQNNGVNTVYNNSVFQKRQQNYIR